MDVGTVDCCILNATFAYTSFLGQTQIATGVPIEYVHSGDPADCVARANISASASCSYRQQIGFARVAYSDRKNDIADAENQAKVMESVFKFTGFGFLGLYGIVLCVVLCGTCGYICGCFNTNKALAHRIKYIMNDLIAKEPSDYLQRMDLETKDRDMDHQATTYALPDGRMVQSIGRGDTNAEWEDVDPDETRRTLKTQYERTKAHLIGKQLQCIKLSEEFYAASNKWVEDIPREKIPIDQKGTYDELYKMDEDLSNQMTTEELDPEFDCVKAFRESLANHLAFDIPSGPAIEATKARKAAIKELVLTADMQYEEAEQLLYNSRKLRLKVMAYEMCGHIVDEDSRDRATAELAAAGATWNQASRYLDEAKEGLHNDKPSILGDRDFSIETIPVNKDRRLRYEPLKQWWENHLADIEVREIESRQSHVTRVPKMQRKAHGKTMKEQETYRKFKPFITKLNQQYEILAELMMQFEDIQSRWSVYLKLANSAVMIDNGSTQRLLREKVRHEMILALRGIFDPALKRPEDKDEIHKLLHEMESVDIAADEYVRRLEENLQQISQTEKDQIEDLLIQLELQHGVKRRLDRVNKGIKESLARLRRIANVQRCLQWSVCIIILITIALCVLILLQDDIFG